MSKRKTAEEAFQIPASVKDFIHHGLQDSSVEQTAPPDAADNTDRDRSAPHEKVIELDEERQVHTITRRTGHGRGVSRGLHSPSNDLSRTYAKATVQKTIRFHPKLIAELEAHNRQQELDDEKPMALQQIQNEALDLWLDRFVRRSK